MKIQAVALLALFSAVNAFDADLIDKDCGECFEDIDEARDCLRECNNEPYYIVDDSGEYILDANGEKQSDDNWGSLLDYCLEDSSEDGPSIDDIDDLVDCCNFRDKDCEKDLEDVEECLVGCMNPCLAETAQEWFECVEDENDSGGCTRQDCLDGFLEDLEDDVDFGSEDVFDLEEVEKRFKEISYQDLEECDLLEEFVVEACDVGDDCCDKCNEELAKTLDCMLNGIVGPFVAAELNTTLPTCTVTDDCKLEIPDEDRKKRGLTEEEANKFNKAMNKITNARRAKLVKAMENRKLEEGEVTSEEAIAACQAKMNQDIVTSNITHATNKYLECVTASVITNMDDGPADATTKEGSGAASVAFKMIAITAAMAAALF